MINCFKNPIHVLMRVLLCKIQSPLFCFCKPISHIYTASSLKLENYIPHASLKTVVSVTSDDAHEEVVDDHVDAHRNGDREEDDDIVDAKEGEDLIVGVTLVLRSSLRKADSNSTEADKEKKAKKKKVQWVDVMGIKELAEIREFEPRLVFYCLLHGIRFSNLRTVGLVIWFLDQVKKMISTLIGEKPAYALSCEPSVLVLLGDLRHRTKLMASALKSRYMEVHRESAFAFYNQCISLVA